MVVDATIYIFRHVCCLKVIASVIIACAETSLPCGVRAVNEEKLPWESLLSKASRGQVPVDANPMENIAVMCM